MNPPLWQRVRHHPRSRYDDVLLPVRSFVADRVARDVETGTVAPQFLSSHRIKGAELSVRRAADEHETTRGRERRARIGSRAGLRDAFGRKLLVFAERHAPDDVPGVGVDAKQLRPWRRIA